MPARSYGMMPRGVLYAVVRKLLLACHWVCCYTPCTKSSRDARNPNPSTLRTTNAVDNILACDSCWTNCCTVAAAVVHACVFWRMHGRFRKLKWLKKNGKRNSAPALTLAFCFLVSQIHAGHHHELCNNSERLHQL